MLHNFTILTIFALLFSTFSSATAGFWSEPVIIDSTPRCAILLHGLGRTSWSMNKIAKNLKKRGYVVWNEGYPSTEKTIQELSLVIDDALEFCKSQNAEGVYFVTHSLGGILVRQYFQDKPSDMVKGVVMLAPPNHGSEVTDAFKDYAWFKYYTGVAGQQLGTEATSVPNSLMPIPVSIGIIAGTSTSDPWFSHVFAGDNDGKVSVESAKLEEMTDFMTVNSGHTFIMKNSVVIDQILYFFTHGSFKK